MPIYKYLYDSATTMLAMYTASSTVPIINVSFIVSPGLDYSRTYKHYYRSVGSLAIVVYIEVCVRGYIVYTTIARCFVCMSC